MYPQTVIREATCRVNILKELNLLDVAAGVVARENDSALKALALNRITTGAKTLQTGQYEPAQSS